MKNTNSNKLNMTTTLNKTERRRAKEAKARRRVNENWKRIEFTNKYLKATAQQVGRNTTDKIAEEVLDGIFLNLNARNSEKSASEQKRLLRRIVEKRQAQAIHAKTRRSRSRKATVAVIINSSKCLERIHNLRFAS